MDLWANVQLAISGALDGVAPQAVRIPARKAACDCYVGRAPAPAPQAFGTLLGAPLVKYVTKKNGRLLFDLTDAFYNACVESVNASLPLPGRDFSDYALNRMLRLLRHAGTGCPNIPSAQRALWLCAGAARSPALKEQAARATCSMLQERPVSERQILLRDCGALFSACARLYARVYTEQAPPDFPPSQP